jgi:hypothetical protein
MKRLYRRIYVRSNPSLKTPLWFLDCNKTEIAGLISIAKRSDQNDYLIYLKILVLMDNLPKYGHLVKELIIFDDVFTEKSGTDHLNDLVDSMEKHCPNLERLHIYDEKVKSFNRDSLKNMITDDLQKLDDVQPIESLTLTLHRYSEELELPDLEKFQMLRELIIEDEESASLRILKKLSDAGISKLQLRRFVFNHVHGLHDYNTVLRELTTKFIENCIDLSQLQEMEMTIGCQEKDCRCICEFLDELAPKLHSLTKVAFREMTFHRDHYITEEWDVDVGRFLINVPSKIKYLAIHHNPPMDGKLLNGLEGNYFRRRKLYENIVPKLKELETFVSPTFLQSTACYEILPSDLLWNGCECEFCSKFLPLYDKYLMDHAYYDTDDADFKDMISPRLFGLFGTELSKRLQYNHDLDALSIPPSSTTWGFHGYQYISCFSDVDDCDFNKLLFEPLVVCVSHFMLEPVKFLKSQMPRLKTVALSGVYFTIFEDNIHCVYDTEDRVVY